MSLIKGWLKNHKQKLIQNTHLASALTQVGINRSAPWDEALDNYFLRRKRTKVLTESMLTMALKEYHPNGTRLMRVALPYPFFCIGDTSFDNIHKDPTGNGVLDYDTYVFKRKIRKRYATRASLNFLIDTFDELEEMNQCAQ